MKMVFDVMADDFGKIDVLGLGSHGFLQMIR
jgi:hypothetical protein